MAKRWYVVQVYAGYEDRAMEDMRRRVADSEYAQLFGDILVPSVKFKETFGMLAEEKDQRMFPGYVLIEMEMTPATQRLIQSVPRVAKFLGGATPAPLSAQEVERVMAGVRGEVVVETREHDFVGGQEVEIVDGAFAGFVGIVDKVDVAAERLTVMVSIFGRLTPVELGFNQVKR